MYEDIRFHRVFAFAFISLLEPIIRKNYIFDYRLALHCGAHYERTYIQDNLEVDKYQNFTIGAYNCEVYLAN